MGISSGTPHIARLPFDARGYFQPHLHSQLSNRPGGAWYLREMIELARKTTREEVERIAADRGAQLQIARQQSEPAVSEATIERLRSAVEQSESWMTQLDVQINGPSDADHVEIEENRAGGVAKAFSVWEWFDGSEKPATARIVDGRVLYKWCEGKDGDSLGIGTEMVACAPRQAGGLRCRGHARGSGMPSR